MPRESPTRMNGMPASSSRRVIGKSYAVSAATFSPRAFIPRMVSGVILAFMGRPANEAGRCPQNTQNTQKGKKRLRLCLFLRILRVLRAYLCGKLFFKTREQFRGSHGRGADFAHDDAR